MNEKQFIEEISKLKIKYTDYQLEQLHKYYNLIVEWNQKFNLTRITLKEDAYLKHFYDALTIIKVINLEGYVLDVGTGAGIPGIVLKIFYPNIKLDLIDSNHKKTLFLETVVKLLNLENVNIYCERAELFAINNREKYSIVISRAVASLNILSELCLPLVIQKGYFIAMKGEATKEIEDSKDSIKILGGEITKIENFFLPINNHERTIILIQKIKVTDKKYPREFAQIVKKPLKKNLE